MRCPLKILLWHGYLLGGTGSNVYTRALARTWSQLGHDVTVFCQEPHPERFDLGSAKVVRPDIGEILPVFVVGPYDDLEAHKLQDLTWEQRRHFVDASAAAVRAHLPADVVFTNHLLLGAPVGAACGVPFAVKAHGSELEFAMRGNQELCTWARETLAGASVIFAGSHHIHRTIEEVVGPGEHLERIRIVPPGVDIEAFAPRPRDEALRGLLAEASRDLPNPQESHDQRRPDEGNAERLGAFLEGDEPTIVYFGKLSREKGVHLLVDALGSIDARTVIAGFGDQRRALEQQAAGKRVLFTGPLEHRHLMHLLPLADVAVTPSVFPEAFGMVAAEAAAAGVPPLVARHSGLAEIAEGLEAEYPAAHRDLASFANGDAAELRRKLAAILAMPAAEHRLLRDAARRAAVARWSWKQVAATLLSAVADGA